MVAAAYTEPDPDTSLRQWQRVFGDSFRKPPSTTSKPRFGPVAVPAAQTGRGG